MAVEMVRSDLRTALRGGQRGAPASKRTFSSSGHQDGAYETANWEKITYAGIVACTILSFANPILKSPLHTHTCTFVFHGASLIRGVDTLRTLGIKIVGFILLVSTELVVLKLPWRSESLI